LEQLATVVHVPGNHVGPFPTLKVASLYEGGKYLATRPMGALGLDLVLQDVQQARQSTLPWKFFPAFASSRTGSS